jgi:hypothetical protein
LVEKTPRNDTYYIIPIISKMITCELDSKVVIYLLESNGTDIHMPIAKRHREIIMD